MAKRQHPYTVHFNVQSIKYLFYIQVWEISVIQRSLTSFSMWSARNQHCSEYMLCRLWILHWTFGGFMASRQDYFSHMSHDKQVDGTEEEVLQREPPHHLQAQCGFFTSSLNGVRTFSNTAVEDQLIKSQWLTAWTWQPPILHLNVAVFL